MSKAVNQNPKTIVLVCLALVTTGFLAGQKFQQFLYDDICLDLGGGRNPGGYPVCVIEAGKAENKYRIQ